jgi:AraC-like DNA-binding protein
MNTLFEFNDGFSGDAIDPLASAKIDFDFDAIDEEIHSLDGDNREKLAHVVRRIFQWICSGNLNASNAPITISRRWLALVWVFDPSLIDGTPSAAALAHRIGCPASKFHTLTGAVTREFKITNRAQRHGDGTRKAVANAPA